MYTPHQADPRRLRVRSRTRLARHESGVFAGIFAILGTLVLGAIMMLGVDLYFTLRSSSILKVFADQVCGQLVNDKQEDEYNILPTLPFTMPDYFSTSLKQELAQDYFVNSRIRVLEADLILPAIPYASQLGRTKFTDLPGVPAPTCQPEVVNDCYLTTNPAEIRFDPASGKYFPPGLLNNIGATGSVTAQFQGTSAFCQFRATVRLPFSAAQRVIDARSAWSMQVNTQPRSGMAIPRDYLPGLTIVIDPSVVVSANNIQYDHFKYDSPSSPYSYKYDILDGVNFGFYKTHAEEPQRGSLAPIRFYDAATVDALQPTGYNYLGPYFSAPQAADLSIACMNPYLLMRNTFVRTIVELAARTGSLSERTEILLMTPRSLAPGSCTSGPGCPSSSPFINRPIEMVSFGDKLIERKYELPLVNFGLNLKDPNLAWANNFLDVNTAADVTGPFHGIFPAKPDSGIGNTRTGYWRSSGYFALMAEQLRLCYHLYSRGMPYGLQLFDLDGAPAFDAASDFLQKRADFPLLSSRLFPWESSGLGSWNAWRTASLGRMSQGAPGAAAAGEKLSASELVGMLGALQLCPFESIDTDSPGYIIPPVFDNLFKFEAGEARLSCLPVDPLNCPTACNYDSDTDSCNKINSAPCPGGCAAPTGKVYSCTAVKPADCIAGCSYDSGSGCVPNDLSPGACDLGCGAPVVTATCDPNPGYCDGVCSYDQASDSCQHSGGSDRCPLGCGLQPPLNKILKNEKILCRKPMIPDVEGSTWERLRLRGDIRATLEYLLSQNRDTHILLVLASPPTQGEINTLRTVVNAIQTPCVGCKRTHRPITVAYFPPAYDSELSPRSSTPLPGERSIDNLIDALFLSQAGEVTGNELYTFSPFLLQFQGSGKLFAPDNPLTTRQTKLYTFWHGALPYDGTFIFGGVPYAANSNEHIIRAAFELFQRRLLKRRMAF